MKHAWNKIYENMSEMGDVPMTINKTDMTSADVFIVDYMIGGEPWIDILVDYDIEDEYESGSDVAKRLNSEITLDGDSLHKLKGILNGLTNLK